MRRFVSMCEKTGLPFRTVPGLAELLCDRTSLRNVRNVRLEDLLGREPIHLDLNSVRAHVKGRVVMVTGAAGSIGSELCRQIVGFEPSRLVCVDQNETGIFYLERELPAHSKNLSVVYCVADVCDSARMRKIFAENRVSIVFHAAAYKHVPVMESNVPEAVSNNVFGLTRLLEVAENAGCKGFVMISSDKAVNPSSVMGCTKRIGELILAAWPADGMRCLSVRFGNVLGSSGSVVPLFQEQLRNNQPLTITHPEIRRYFMTISEAVSLVLQGFAIGDHGDILVLDMGEPIRILDMAHTLIKLCGKAKDGVEIKFTGLREGEKLFEELFYPNEQVLPTVCGKIKRTKNGSLVLWPELSHHLEELRACMHVNGSALLRQKMREIVPEYGTEAKVVGSPDIPLPARRPVQIPLAPAAGQAMATLAGAHD